MTEHILQLLRTAPLIDGHNDLLWALRTLREAGEDEPDLAGAHAGPADRPAADRRRRDGRAVLVGLRAVEPARARSGDADARADRCADRPVPSLSGPARTGPDRRRRRADRGLGQGRVDDRRRGRPLHRELALGPARPRAVGRRLHDAHPQRRHGLGRFGDGCASARRPHRLRRGRGARDEPAAACWSTSATSPRTRCGRRSR